MSLNEANRELTRNAKACSEERPIRGIADVDRSPVHLDVLEACRPRRLQIDINLRTPHGLTPASFEGVPPVIGERAIAFEPEDRVRADAVVEDIELHRRLALLRVDWESMDDDEGPTSFAIAGNPGRSRVIR